MAVTPYKATSWQDNEPIFTSKLNQMTNNDQWLYENTPRMMYTAYNQKRTEGLKVACGYLLCQPAANGIQQHTVQFPNFFSEACTPIVITGLMHNGEVRLHHGIRGINQQYPDHRGFEILGNVDVTGKWTRMTKIFWIPWIAMGF